MKVKEDPTTVFVTKSLVLYIFREPKTFPSTVTVKLRIMITWIYKEFKSPKLKENWFWKIFGVATSIFYLILYIECWRVWCSVLLFFLDTQDLLQLFTFAWIKLEFSDSDIWESERRTKDPSLTISNKINGEFQTNSYEKNKFHLQPSII